MNFPGRDDSTGGLRWPQLVLSCTQALVYVYVYVYYVCMYFCWSEAEASSGTPALGWIRETHWRFLYIGIFLNYESKILEFCMKIGVGQTIGFGELHSPCTWRDTVGSPPTYFWTLERLRRPDKFHHLSGASRSSTATSGQQEEWVPNPGFYRIFGKSMKINKNINFVCDSLPAHLPVGRWSLPRSGKSSGGAWEVMRSVTGGAVGVPLPQSPETCQGCCQNCPYQPTRRLGGLEVPKPIFGPTPIFIQDLDS